MSGMQIPLFDDSAPKSPRAEWGEQLLQPIPIHKDQAASPVDLVPDDAIVRFTNNYNISGSLISRFLSFFNDLGDKPIKLLQDTLSSELAIPSERIRGLMNFSRKTELLTSENHLTSLGKIYLKYDQYFLNPGSLWLLHYLLSSNAFVPIWSRLFNTVVYQVEEISPADMPGFFKDIQGGTSDKMFHHNGSKELGAVLRTYSEGIFKPLGLMVRVGTGRYLLISDEFDIPPLVWISSILAYRDRFYPGAASLETHLLIDGHFSPGHLFRQKEEVVRQALERLHNLGLITLETRLGLDQVRFKREITWISAIARYFEEAK
jgi:hypothetical protein